jgi:hypothetical protein
MLSAAAAAACRAVAVASTLCCLQPQLSAHPASPVKDNQSPNACCCRCYCLQGRGSGVNFALPADLVREIVPNLIVYGTAAGKGVRRG